MVSWVELCQFNGLQLCDLIQMLSLQMLIHKEVIRMGSNPVINVLTESTVRLECA